MSEPQSSALPSRRYQSMTGAVSYYWRDPEHLSAAQLAALDARTRPEPPEPAQRPHKPQGWTPKRDRYDAARDAGKSFTAAMDAAGCTLRSAQRYEHDRQRREAPGT